MNVKKTPMSLFQKIFYICSFIFLIGAFIYLGTKDYGIKEDDLSDAENFTQEFGITSDNVFTYKTGRDVLEIMNTGTAVIFFAFPENDWSHTYASLLNEVAIYYGVDEIDYYNFYTDRGLNNSYYENIVKQLTAYLPIVDTGAQNIYAPTVVFVKDGEIIAYDDETSIVGGNDTVDNYWTTEKKEAKKVELGVYFKKFLEDTEE